MTQIIRKDFKVKDYNRMVMEFLYADVNVHLAGEELKQMRDYLFTMGPPFRKMFQAYFKKHDNRRYDDLTHKMSKFIKHYIKHTEHLQREQRAAFTIFWNDMADIIKSDYMLLRDSYLANSCNYFIYKIIKHA